MNLQVPYKPGLLTIRTTSFSNKKKNCNVFLVWWCMMVQRKLYYDGFVVLLLFLIREALTRRFVFLPESFCGFPYFLQAHT